VNLKTDNSPLIRKTMSQLSQKSCKACGGGVPPLTEEEQGEFLPQVNSDWFIIEGHHLERSWAFDDFAQALDFTNRIGAICEQEGHHADFELGWGRVKALIWTHKIDGLTMADFILAAKLDNI